MCVRESIRNGIYIYMLWHGSENDDAERRNTHEFVTKFPSKIKPINDSNFNFGK